MNSDERFNKDFPKMWEDMIANDGELPLPDSFDYVPTLRCNLNCPGCFQKKDRFNPSNELTFDEFKLMLDKLDVKDKIFKVIGGEIFVRDYIYDMLCELRQRDANLIIGTNALESPNEDYIKYWNPVEMTTSIDGLAETHDKMRGTRGSFKAVRDFIYDNGIYGLGYKILTTTMIYDNNLDQIENIYKLKDRLGIERMRFQIPKWSSKEEIKESINILGKDSILDVSRYPYKFNEEDIYKLPIFFDNKNYFIQPYYFQNYPKETIKKRIRKNHKCMCTYLFRCKINPDGEVNPCFYILNKMGNLKDKSLEEIWNSKEYKEFRMKLADNNLLPICENCCSMRILE